MTQMTGWVPDPYGIHELRFFSAGGKPTLLVMDGGKRSYDMPPTDSPAAPKPSPGSESEPDPDLTQRFKVDPSSAGGRRPGLESARTVADAEEVGDRINVRTSDIDTDQSADLDVASAPERPRMAASPVTHLAENPSARVVDRTPEPMSRALKIAYGVVFGVLALSVLGLAYVHLHHPQSPPSRSAQRATTTSSVLQTTTTIALPTSLKPGAEAAATALISSWSNHSRSAALTVATQAAVNTLFAVPYANGLAEDRGCSTSFTPIVCTFGPPGGASPNDPIYQIYVSQAPGGWYVSSVKLENVGSGNTSTST